MELATAAEMREMDRRTIEDFGIPGRVLMETAARGAVSVLLKLFPGAASRRIGVMAGKGNNGGDGFVMARCLKQMGAEATVYLLARAQEISGDAAANLALLPKMGVPVTEIPDSDSFGRARPGMEWCDLWIDAILGTGLNSEVRGLYRDAILFLNEARGPVFSVDVPSGLFSDTGAAPLCVRADATATFGLPKIGQWVYPGASFRGVLEVVDIGIPRHVVEAVNPRHFLADESWARGILKPRKPTAHKGDAGHLLVVAGSPGKTGAAFMASHAALRAGAGLVTLAAPTTVSGVLEGRVTEAMTEALPASSSGGLSEAAFEPVMRLLEGKRALALGPGMGTDPETVRLVRRLVVESPVPVVADADALNALAWDASLLKNARSAVILTPHPGEMSRLSGRSTAEIQADRIGSARAFSETHGVWLVLKGAHTVSASPDGRAGIVASGNPGMASGGMGDVLTGVTGALLVQGYGPDEAATLGAYLHGLSADILAAGGSPVGYLASEVADALPRAVSRCLAPHPDGGPKP